ncbi:MAG: deoxynucleoside kinase [Gammaproteobacteria bacterium]|nr:deoxynucleoside kinase [Gammaproteobacteria bacterium]
MTTAAAPAPVLGRGFVAIEGPIGVGKTSLARRLADVSGAEPLLEMPEENPFLARFYEDRRHFALSAQLFFLFQRRQMLDDLRQASLFSRGVVSDFLWAKDRLFARINLSDDEWRLYEQVAGTVEMDLPAPELVIFLQAPIEVLFERIRRRGRGYERVDRDYLAEVATAYTDFFHGYQDSPLLIVNAAEVNFVESDEDVRFLVDYLDNVRNGRHFFNPLPSGFAG